MISLEEAQARLLALGNPLSVETIPISVAHGRFVAAPILAKRTQPARDLSAMDGFAIAHSSMPGPWDVVGESAAGAPFGGSISDQQAVRIFTGAALPEGADTIIIQEDVARTENSISIAHDLHPSVGQHVRRAGSDFAAGDELIAAGERLTPVRIALAISGGHGEVSVHQSPRVTILSTGNELVAAGAPTSDTIIPESNAPMIASMLADLNCAISLPGIIPDDLAQLSEAIKKHAAASDILVTIGGASVGDHDLVRPTLEACGADLDFWKIAMRPGKPVFAGKLGDCLILGLPGNPVSAFVSGFLLLKPLAALLAGSAHPLPPREIVTLAADLPANGVRLDHVRARRENGRAMPVGVNDSAALHALAIADTLLVRPPHAPPAKSGDPSEAYFFA